ncbi:SDR family NAD(P)-dependent oxidoreductase [Futiania mangrovi]|uniref:SDR family oxidoreductase n=1 Tax=Futiania mangrovi TaxID=2959716 RepID=A0A9J6PMI3_9PROT|nr:SDR family NAD(P)-dependent oxidoreductase [Futiania mangrovii]MCP1337258.1 SDR family oxidoreductase [Futiania mangrovii]
METGLAGRLVLITGGASGIGRATAEAFAAEGARVAIADRDGAAAESAASALGGVSLAFDVGDETAVADAVARIEAGEGPIDVLVTCAGVLQKTLPPDELSWKEWDLVQRVHVRGTYACAREAGTAMARRGRGAIVTISSVAGLVSGPLHSYAPAKAAIAELTRTLAGEWGPRGVRVNAVAPGFTETPALARGFATGTLDEDALAASAALGRLVAAREIADAIVFLASDRASAITGAVLPVDAGYLTAVPWSAYGGLRRGSGNGSEG